MKIDKINPYGGNNKNPKPFEIGTKLRQKNGTEEWEVTGYWGDQILIKPLNEAALLGVDTLSPHVIETDKKMGFNPSTEPQLLYYKYADGFENIP